MKALIQRTLSWASYSPIVSLAFALAVSVVFTLGAIHHLSDPSSTALRITIGYVIIVLAMANAALAFASYAVRRPLR